MTEGVTVAPITVSSLGQSAATKNANALQLSTSPPVSLGEADVLKHVG